MTIHICAPESKTMHLATHHCPTCQGDRLFLNEHTPWWGLRSTCLNCGDVWVDGYMLPRPVEWEWHKRRMRQAWEAFYRFRGITR